MNKVKLFLILFLIIISITVYNSQAKASVDISIGANTWYSEWKPVWATGKLRLPPYFYLGPGSISPVSLDNSVNKFEFQKDMKFLYGPILSIRFLDKWSLSTIFMLGRYRANSKGAFINEYFFTAIFIDSNYRREILKYDSDSTLNYSVHKYVKIFLGFKYQGYNFKESLFYLAGDFSGYFARGSSKNVNYGPALGLSLSIPVYSGLFVLYNISGSFLFSSDVYKVKRQVLPDLPNLRFLGEYNKERYYAYAGNTSFSLAYYFRKVGLTLALGFRYQVLFFQHENQRRGFLNLNGRYEHFYGGSFSAVYSFRVGGTREKKALQ